MMRYALGLEYLGTHYKGWQKQPGYPTIQQHLEEALSQIANEPIEVICAGRTDAGVHAIEQVVHFDTHAKRPDIAWILGVNRYLPKDIAVRWIKRVNNDFSARYSAISRRYQYRIHNCHTRSAIDHALASWYHFPLDEKRMHEAAQCLLGEHDFSAFRGPHCQSKTPIRRVDGCHVVRENQHVIIEIQANAFLHHMVRNIVGCLLEIGKGNKPIDWLSDVLSSRDRRMAAAMAKPEGLYLANVEYPQAFFYLNLLGE